LFRFFSIKCELQINCKKQKFSIACPSCPNGECGDGVLGTGKCNCNTGWIQSLTNTSTNVEKCDACALDYWGSDCKRIFYLFFFLFFFFRWNERLACPNCGHGICNNGISGDGECTCHIGWTSTDEIYCGSCATGYYGSDCSLCAPGYYRNGLECIECGDNKYLFNETTCLPCPQNSERMLKQKSILDCNCTSFNHYPDNQTSTCLPCQYGYLLNDSNICQGTFSWKFYLFIYLFFFFFWKLKHYIKRDKMLQCHDQWKWIFINWSKWKIIF